MKFSLFKLFLLILFLIPLFVNGQTECTEPACPAGAICFKNPLTACDFRTLVTNLVSFLLTVASAVVGLMIVVGGFYFVTSAGSPERVEKGKKLIFYALLGLLIVILATAFITALECAMGVKGVLCPK